MRGIHISFFLSILFVLFLQSSSSSAVLPMALRLRKGVSDLEMATIPSELPIDQNASQLQKLLEVSRHREKKLLKALFDAGIEPHLDLDDEIVVEESSSFYRNLYDRSRWLIGLLLFQSLSSFILHYNEKILQSHPSLIYFLTMLVGAGGNAGNQATVRGIRAIAIGKLSLETAHSFVYSELIMAFAISGLLGIFGFFRVILSAGCTMSETATITTALVLIVYSSIAVGAVLPILFYKFGIDPAHSSTTIQVLMDIAGVLIVSSIAAIFLSVV